MNTSDVFNKTGRELLPEKTVKEFGSSVLLVDKRTGLTYIKTSDERLPVIIA